MIIFKKMTRFVPDSCRDPGKPPEGDCDRCGRGGLGDALGHRTPASAQCQHDAGIGSQMDAGRGKETGGSGDCKAAV